MTAPRAARALLTITVLLAPSSALAADYDVGDGETYAAIADVPWTELVAGDVVNIHWRAEPYHERWGIVVSGTEDDPIRVVGVASDTGELPIIDGADAAEGPDAHPRGLVTIREGAQYVHVEGLELRGATVDNGFPDAASAIYVEDGAHLEFRGLVMHDCGNGFFTAPDAADVLLAGSWIYGNGNDGSLFEHNAYTESDGIVYEYNRFGLLRDGALGTNLKDRSAHTVVRYNLIEGGNRALDLVEPEGGADSYGDAAQNDPTFVYGNVLIKRDDDPPNSQVVHFGGDADSGGERRNLFFYNNTVFSTRETTTAFFFNAAEPTAVIVNNIFVTTAAGSSLRLLDTDTSLAVTGVLGNNFFADGWVVSADDGLSFDGLVESGTLLGSDPGFVSLADEDLALVAGATARDAGVVLPPELAQHPVANQLVVQAGLLAAGNRFDDAVLDLGAFEYCEEADCDGPVGTTGEDPGDGSGDEGADVSSDATADDGTQGEGASVDGSASASADDEGGSGPGDGSDGAGSADAGATDDDNGGCGCREGGGRSAHSMVLSPLLLLARRRRSR